MKIVIVSSSESREAQAIKAHLTSDDKRHHVTCSAQTSLAEAFASDADLIILARPNATEDVLAEVDGLTTQHPGPQIVLASDQQSPEFLHAAMRAGVREVLALPPTKAAIEEVVASAERKASFKAKPHANGKVFAFIGCKGGAGTTFLATNWAHLFAGDPVRKVAFLDLNRQFGDALFYLSDAVPPMDLADLAKEAGRLDASLLAGSMVPVRPNLHLLAAPETPEKGYGITVQEIASVLKHAAREYDAVIVDLGNVVDDISALTMDTADRIYPVMQATVPYLRAATRLSKVLRAYPREKVEWIINRYEEQGDVSLRDVASALNQANLRTVAGSFRTVCASIAQGVPLAELDKRDRVLRDLQRWAASVFPTERPAHDSGWLKRWMPRREPVAQAAAAKA